MQFIGGSSYIGGCNAAYPITYLPGVTGTVPGSQTMPGGSNRSDYIPEVGVGKVGAYDTLLPGGNGAIVLLLYPKLLFHLPKHLHLPLLYLPTLLQSNPLQLSQPLLHHVFLLLLSLSLFLLFLQINCPSVLTVGH